MIKVIPRMIPQVAEAKVIHHQILMIASLQVNQVRAQVIISQIMNK